MHMRVRFLLLVAMGLLVLAACGVPEEPPPAVEHEVSVALAGDGQGTVTSSPPGIDVAAGTPAASFVANTVVTLTATPEEGSRFVGFTFEDPDRTCEAGSTENTCVITVDDAIDVTATFVEVEEVVPEDPVLLTVVTVGDGTVTREPSGTVVEDAFQFERGDEVTLTAVPAEGAEFVSWDPAAVCAENTEANVCVITLTEDTTTITATFTEVELADPATVSVAIVGNGSVTSDPAGVDTAAGQDSAEFESGDTVTLMATPAAGWAFVGWEPDLVCQEGSAVNPCVVVAVDGLDVTATFEELPVGTEMLTVNVETANDAAGEVTSNPPGIDTAAGMNDAPFDIGTSVTLTAEATAGAFAGWTGDVCPVAADPVCTFTIVEGQPAVTANFNEPTTVTFQLQQQNDNAEEFLADSINSGNINDRWPTGHTYTFSTSLELGYDPAHAPQAVGLRFPGVTLPPNANVLSASIGFTARAATGTGTPVVTIEGEAVADAPAFQADPNPPTGPNPGGFDVTSRARTDASVTWEITEAWDADETYQSLDLVDIVREVVAIDGWSAGNAMAFIILPTDITSTAFRRAHSFTGEGANPFLTVQYVPLP